MSLLVNTCKKSYASNDIVCSPADLLVITNLMEGVVSVFDEVGLGGTDVPTPSKKRVMKFGVNRKADRLGCTVTLKHVKPGKNEVDIFAHKALFDADYKHSMSATGIRQIYGGEI
ncbi:hypothetical protein Sulku_1341 [Sulfuricurvum kujiense DSM 16994]|uniref:Uncharacterized protein n=2 Tax=Sulfuricurvum kujiense TaxID=148813 RepID=E4TY84_SULKY|nr:hypothetical protein Sulku_1341 [Sulfuricurvum kujiense DSM 16994]